VRPAAYRRVGAVGLALILLVAAPAAAAVRRTAAAHAAAGPVCPVGQVLVTSHGVPGSWYCFHPGSDTMPMGGVGSLGDAKRYAELQPKCYGIGVNGSRVELIYAYPKGTASKFAWMSRRITKELIPRLEATVRLTSRRQGQEIGLRFYMPSCRLIVHQVQLPADVASDKQDVFTQAAAISDYLAGQGFDRRDRKYLVWVDGMAGGDNRPGSPFVGVRPCGIGSAPIIENPNGLAYGPSDQPAPVSVYDGALSAYALIYRTPGKYYGDTCWGAGDSGAEVETHELFHTLGAVQYSAPNSNRHSHCIDGGYILCYAEFGISVLNVCPGVKQLDCGGDDYFNVRPAAGSYLSTHWNTARTSFTSDALVDAVPTPLP
jgi:hypothetical protein